MDESWARLFKRLGIKHKGEMVNNHVWRMSFRAGDRGPKMWPECLRYGVAAITYDSLEKVDLSQYPNDEPKKRWGKLQPTQKASLRRVAYEMKAGDTIFVKEGKQIVGQGTVTSGYKYDYKNRIRCQNGYYWNHQVPVKWQRDFAPFPLLLGAEQLTVLLLDKARIRRTMDALGQRRKQIAREEVLEGKTFKAEITFRQRNRTIIAAKKALSNGKCETCGFSFKNNYGLRDKDCLVAHHLKPIASRGKSSITRIEDLILLCPNCHAVAHTQSPPLSPVRIRRMVKT